VTVVGLILIWLSIARVGCISFFKWLVVIVLKVPLRAAAHQLRQDKHQDVRQKKQKLTSALWLRPVCGGFHNLIRFNCAPFFVSCRRHRVLTVTCLDACRYAAYLVLSVQATNIKEAVIALHQSLEHGTWTVDDNDEFDVAHISEFHTNRHSPHTIFYGINNINLRSSVFTWYSW
jgi:hypothetical protein